MPATNRSELAAFDADRVRQAVQETVSGPLYAFCEYDTESFRPLYLSDETVSMYESRDAMLGALRDDPHERSHGLHAE